MPQLGSDEKPIVMHTGTIVSKESRYRRGFDKKKYDENYDRIFRKDKKDVEECICFDDLDTSCECN
tara:strand:+ start:575 stop:772 length:198 start_codon:yes stop_codon:yes gene_type:complete